MKKILLIFMLCSLLGFINCSATRVDTIEVESKISTVNVFFEGALVERRVHLSLPMGRHLLAVRGLPLDIDPELIKVRGPADSRILSVSQKVRVPSKRSIEPQFDRLNSLRKELEDRIEWLRVQKEVFAAERAVIMENTELKKSEGTVFAGGMKQTADFYRSRLTDLARLNFDNTISIREAQDSIKLINSEINQLLAGLNIPRTRLLILIEVTAQMEGDILIAYFTRSAGWQPVYDFRFESVNSPLEVVYNAHVFQSSGEDWEDVALTLTEGLPKEKAVLPEFDPYYIDQKESRQKADYRLSHTGESGSLTGTIRDKETGEPLPFVNIVLGERDHRIAGAATDFDGKYIVKPIPRGVYDMQISYVGYNPKRIEGVGINADKITFLDIELESGMKLEEFQVVEYGKPLIDNDGGSSGGLVKRSEIAVSRGGSASIRGARQANTAYYINGVKVRGAPNVTSLYIDERPSISKPRISYSIPYTYSVPSNGEDRLLTIKSEEVKVEFLYRAIPRQDTDVYLLARVTDWGNLQLLSGKTTIYFQGAYSGESHINANVVEDTLEIALGRDEQILIDRRLDEERSVESAFGNKIKRELHWQVTARNNKSHPIKLELIDQFPMSSTKSIEIDALHWEGADRNEKTGKLTWDMVISANRSETVGFGYELKYPQSTRVYDR